MMRLVQLLRNIPVKIGNRFLIVLIVVVSTALLLGGAGLAYLWTQSKSTPPKIVQKDCASCHSEIYAGWHNDAHGDVQSKHALAQESNCIACHKTVPVVAENNDPAGPARQDFSINVGSPNHCLNCHTTGYDQTTGKSISDGITCEACHGIIPKNHPDAAAPVNKSTDTCRNCHSDARFNWDKWKDSVHYQNSMTCVTCHNPHTTSLKIVGQAQDGDASQLCKNCHQDLTQSYEHSLHQKVKVSCVDCHIGPSKGNDDFHKVPDHDFKAKIDACNTCHTDQMHSLNETKIAGISATAQIKPYISVQSNEKQPKSLAAIMVVIVLLGVVGGGVMQKRFFK